MEDTEEVCKMQFEYRGYIGVIGYRNYYIRDMNGKTHVQALCCEKPTEENVKKAIDRFIKGERRRKNIFIGVIRYGKRY